MIEGSRWFRRLVKDLRRISPHLRVRRIKYGFYRVYWKHAYIGEMFKEMPQVGYHKYDNDWRFQEKSFFEEKEDRAELTRKVKNFVEGYWESLDRIKTRVWMLKHDKEFYQEATGGYKRMNVK